MYFPGWELVTFTLLSLWDTVRWNFGGINPCNPPLVRPCKSVPLNFTPYAVLPHNMQIVMWRHFALYMTVQPMNSRELIAVGQGAAPSNIWTGKTLSQGGTLSRVSPPPIIWGVKSSHLPLFVDLMAFCFAKTLILLSFWGPRPTNTRPWTPSGDFHLEIPCYPAMSPSYGVRSTPSDELMTVTSRHCIMIVQPMNWMMMLQAVLM